MENENTNSEEIKDSFLENSDLEKENTYTSETEVFSTEKTVITDNELSKFIGPKNLDYYFNVFKKHSDSENFISWNWCAFLFTPFWLLYRKLYGWFAILAGVTMALDFVYAISTVFGGILKLVVIVLFGLFGNCIYLYHCKKRIKKINSNLTDTTFKDDVLKANGGTNTVAPFVLFLIILAFIIFIAILVVGVLSSPSFGLQSLFNLNGGGATFNF